MAVGTPHTTRMTEILTKACLTCGLEIRKQVNVSQKRWDESKSYCSISCSKKGNTYRRGKTHPNIWNRGLPGKRGAENANWKGGRTPWYQVIRTSLEYKLWREAVFERDGYACVWCGDATSGNLQADHIKKFADFPELRLAIDNGRTLCVECHRKTDTYGNKKPL